jgi:hypothetical protein
MRLIITSLVAGLALAAGGSAGPNARESASNVTGDEPAKRMPTDASCPRGARELPRGALGPATRAALMAVPRDSEHRGAIATIAARAPYDTARGAPARRRCGASAQRRTVVVDLLYPKLQPSQSLSQGVVYVSRFKSGYRVWEVVR